jgi:hypothetical protein
VVAELAEADTPSAARLGFTFALLAAFLAVYPHMHARRGRSTALTATPVVALRS